jgi:hypothetical protein
MGPLAEAADAEPDLAAAQEAAEALEEGPAGELLGSEPLERQEEDISEAGSRRVVAGPAMPSAELLAAAAEAKEAVRRAPTAVSFLLITHRTARSCLQRLTCSTAKPMLAKGSGPVSTSGVARPCPCGLMDCSAVRSRQMKLANAS